MFNCYFLRCSLCIFMIYNKLSCVMLLFTQFDLQTVDYMLVHILLNMRKYFCNYIFRIGIYAFKLVFIQNSIELFAVMFHVCQSN